MVFLFLMSIVNPTIFGFIVSIPYSIISLHLLLTELFTSFIIIAIGVIVVERIFKGREKDEEKFAKTVKIETVPSRKILVGSCPKCGAKFTFDAHYCERCGAVVKIRA